MCHAPEAKTWFCVINEVRANTYIDNPLTWSFTVRSRYLRTSTGRLSLNSRCAAPGCSLWATLSTVYVWKLNGVQWRNSHVMKATWCRCVSQYAQSLDHNQVNSHIAFWYITIFVIISYCNTLLWHFLRCIIRSRSIFFFKYCRTFLLAQYWQIFNNICCSERFRTRRASWFTFNFYFCSIWRTRRTTMNVCINTRSTETMLFTTRVILRSMRLKSVDGRSTYTVDFPCIS